VLAATVIGACAALVLAGVVMIVRWGGVPASERGERASRLRWAGVALAAGALAGMVAAGAGGRLVMRLLALTSPDAAGGLTEAQATIGDITVGGTLGLILFAGLPAGVLTGALYALAGPLLPPGRLGGALLGLLVLVLLGGIVEPLRADNIDFVLLGPDWLSVLAFTALAVFEGMLVVAIAQRLSRRGVPQPTRRTVLAGRIVLIACVLATLPSFAGAVSDILVA
jgi:hypothetical protein